MSELKNLEHFDAATQSVTTRSVTTQPVVIKARQPSMTQPVAAQETRLVATPFAASYLAATHSTTIQSAATQPVAAQSAAARPAVATPDAVESIATAQPDVRKADHYPWLVSGLATLLLFVMLIEWTRPLMQLSAVTGIHTLEPFVLALFCFLAIDYLRIYAWLAWPLKVVAVFIVISMFFYERPLYDPFWWEQYSLVSLRDLETIASGSAAGISGENRTLLMLVGLSMMVYSLHYIVVRRQLCGWFTMSSISYLALLQLIFGLDTTRAVFICLTAGLTLTALLQQVKWRSRLLASRSRDHTSFAAWQTSDHSKQTDQSNQTHHIDQDKQNEQTKQSNLQTQQIVTGHRQPQYGDKHSTMRGSFISMAGALLVVGLAVMIGLWNTADEPRLSKPLDWNVYDLVREVTSLTRGHMPVALKSKGVQGIAATGYSLEDYPLGGSVIPADTAVFTALSDRLSYWRGETKAYYDGRGWSDGIIESAKSLASNPTSMPPVRAWKEQFDEATGEVFEQLYAPIVHRVTLDDTAALFLENTLFSAGDITEVQSVRLAQEELQNVDEMLQIDHASLRYYMDTGDHANRQIAFYQVEAVPVPHDLFTPQTIETAYLAARQNQLSNELSATEAATYLQLPDKLSDRLRKLAGQLTEGAEHELDAARQIAEYLRSHYSYDLQAAELPSDQSEFVDHFLFEQQSGYCDHFSTAMAVLLRMNDIPSRWVKGFTPGEISSASVDGVQSDVRALHAHSWVEAYFPELGWVAFEPTPSYAGSLLPVSAAPISEPIAGGGRKTHRPTWWQGPATMVLSDGGESVRSAASLQTERMNDEGNGRFMDLFADWVSRMNESTLPVANIDIGTNAVLGALVAILLLAVLAYTYRKCRLAIKVWSLERRLRTMERRGGTAMLMEHLWRDVFRKHGSIGPGQTLREYVLQLKLRKQHQQEALIELAVLYETLRYHHRIPARISRSRMSKLWRAAIG